MMLSEIESIMLYFFSFVCSIVIAYLFQKKLDNISFKAINNEKIKYFIVRLLISIVVAMPLIFIAALRSDDVGIDTREYTRFYEEYGSAYSNVFDYYHYRGEDFIFSCISVISYKISHSPCFFYGVLQAIACVPIFYCATKNTRIKMWQAVSIYCFLFFNNSLNMTRQAAALGLIVLFYQECFEKKRIKAMISILLAMGIHFSAILVAPLMYISNYIIKKEKSRKYKIRIIILCCLLVVVSKYIFQYAYSLGIMPYRYFLYVDVFLKGVTDTTSAAWIVITKRVYILIAIRLALVGILYKYISSKDKKIDTSLFIYAMSVFMFISGVIVWHTSYFSRVTIYLAMIVFYLLPYMDNDASLNIRMINGKKMHSIFSLCGPFLYWLLFVVIMGESASIPYGFR